MDDQIDDKLKKRILEVFEDFEAPSADEGWLLLRQKFPEKKDRRPAAWMWWSAAAAIVLICFSIVLFTNSNQDQTKKFTYKNTKVHTSQTVVNTQKKDTVAEQIIEQQAHSTNGISKTSLKQAAQRNNKLYAVEKPGVIERSTSDQYLNTGEPALAGSKKTITTIDSSNSQPAQNPAKQNVLANNVAATAVNPDLAKKPVSIFEDNTEEIAEDARQ